MLKKRFYHLKKNYSIATTKVTDEILQFYLIYAHVLDYVHI